MTTPLVGVTADFKEVDERPFHVVGDKYLRAVSDCTDATPFIVPAMGHHLDIPELVRHMDGLVLTGSPANVHPTHYGHEPQSAARSARPPSSGKAGIMLKPPSSRLMRKR